MKKPDKSLSYRTAAFDAAYELAYKIAYAAAYEAVYATQTVDCTAARSAGITDGIYDATTTAMADAAHEATVAGAATKAASCATFACATTSTMNEWLEREKFLMKEFTYLPSDLRDQLIAFDKKRYFNPESVTLADMLLVETTLTSNKLDDARTAMATASQAVADATVDWDAAIDAYDTAVKARTAAAVALDATEAAYSVAFAKKKTP